MDINEVSIESKLNTDSILLSNVCGTSMFPFLFNNTSVTISKTSIVRLYDVVLFKINNKYILHRVIAINDDIYSTLGDNCLDIYNINKESILGVLSGYYRFNKYIKITPSINKRYYYLSIILKPFIRIKMFIRDIIK